MLAQDFQRIFSPSGLPTSMNIVLANGAFLAGHNGKFGDDYGPLLRFLEAREGLEKIVLQF